MRTVEDDAGNRYLLLKESADSSRVRDPETGEERYIPNDRLTAVAGVSPLEAATAGLPEGLKRVLTAVHSERALGLLFVLEAEGPLSVRTLLGTYDLCESDLHGLLGEFRAAGLIEETSVNGDRGYRTTDLAADAVAALRG